MEDSFPASYIYIAFYLEEYENANIFNEFWNSRYLKKRKKRHYVGDDKTQLEFENVYKLRNSGYYLKSLCNTSKQFLLSSLTIDSMK